MLNAAEFYPHRVQDHARQTLDFVSDGPVLPAMPAPHRSCLLAGGHLLDRRGRIKERLFGAYALVYLVDGSGSYVDRHLGRISVGRGDVLFIFPDVSHGYAPGDDQYWSEYWLSFNGPLFRELEREGLLDRTRPVLSPGFDPILTALFDQLVDESQRPAASHSDLALRVGRLHVLIAEIVDRHHRRRTHPRDADLVAATRAALEEDLARPFDLEGLARRLQVGYDRLRRAFTRETGLSPSRYRLHRRAERAKNLLAAGTSVAETAERLGYCDQFFFARQFKMLTGQTPGAWRRRTAST